MTLSCSEQSSEPRVKVERVFGAVVRATDSPDTVVRPGGFSSTELLAGRGRRWTNTVRSSLSNTRTQLPLPINGERACDTATNKER